MPESRCYRWVAVLVLLAGGVLLGTSLLGGQRLAFRDVGHFYAPLYGGLDQQVGQGQVPLWNPLDHTGLPVLGETTTALLYPPRWLFALPLPAAAVMAWYVLLHWVLAGVNASVALRAAGANPMASAFGALAYALSGPIVFLYCNPPFLVGAAWLPLGVSLGLRLLDRGGTAAVLAAGTVFALPVLGGDPQTAIHVGVLVVLVWTGRSLAAGWRRILGRRDQRQGQAERPDPRRLERGQDADAGRSAMGLARSAESGRGRRVLPMLAAILLAVLLALPQVAASLDWARHSARRFAPPDGMYDYSTAPWQFLDLAVPYAGGRLFPVYQRLSAALPADSRVWTVSLYGGVLTLCLAAAHYVRQGRARRGGPCAKRWRWDAWDVILPLGVLMALGHYGPLWVWRALLGWFGVDAGGIDPATGSPYWLLSKLLPGYEAFRYPAKWLPFVSMGLAVAAGRSLTGLLERQPTRGRRQTQGRRQTRGRRQVPGQQQVLVRGWLVAAVGCGAAAAVLAVRPLRGAIASWLEGQIAPDAYWGPLRGAAAIGDWSYSLTHVALVASAAWLLLRYAHQRPWLSMRWTGGLLCGLLVIDLLAINYPLVAAVSTAQEIRWVDRWGIADADAIGARTLLRTGPEAPAVWSRTSLGRRVAEVAASERLGLQGRWHLSAGHRIFNSATSITPQRYQSAAVAAAEWNAGRGAEAQTRFWRAVGRRWGISAWAHSSGGTIAAETDRGQSVRLAESRLMIDADFPRPTTVDAFAWHTTWQRIAPRRQVSPADWAERFGVWEDAFAETPVQASELFPGLSNLAVPLVEDENFAVTDPPTGLLANVSRQTPIEVMAWSSDRVRVQVEPTAAGLLSRATYQDGNWHGRYRRLPSATSTDVTAGPVSSGGADGVPAWESAEVLPVDYLGQAVFLPAGRWEVEFVYRPWWLVPSFLLSIATLAAMGYQTLRVGSVARRGT